MQYLFWTLSLILNQLGNDLPPASFDYEKAWAKVEALRNSGQPKSALTEVEMILVQAKNEKNVVQQVKSVKVKAELKLETEDNGIQSIINFIKSEIAEAPEPGRQVLYSYLAELYQGYYTENSYTISQRTVTASSENEDIETWDSQRFHEVILANYVLSVQGKNLEVASSDWKELMVQKDSVDAKIRPTLYTLLWDRLLDYLNHSMSSVQLGLKGKYIIKAPEYLGSANGLQKMNLQDEKYFDDPLYQMLQGYQRILKADMNHSDLSRADYFLSYLKFVYQHGQIEQKDSLYKAALLDFIQAEKNNPYVTMAVFELGQFYVNADNPQEALDWFNKGIEWFPDSPGAQSCKQGKAEILQPEAQLTTEEVYTKGENIRFALDYKNLVSVDILIHKIDNKNVAKQNYDQVERYTSLMQGATKVYAKEWQLPENNKYKMHLTESELPALPYGTYLMEIKGKKDSDNSELHNYTIFHVSDLSTISWREANQMYYKVVDRLSGKPVKKAEVVHKELAYDNKQRKEVEVASSSKKTDKNGIATFDVKTQRRIEIIVKNGEDVLDLHQTRYYYQNERHEQVRHFAEVFTDRAIYRPGQIVHFKAISIRSFGPGKLEVLDDTEVEVQLMDANHQPVEKRTLKTNKYGSVAGSFTLPTGRLTGDCFILVQNKKGVYGQKYFKVEEYKRPTFEILPDTLNGNYALNQEVKAGGRVANYAGNALDGALVKYKVVRGVRFIDWGWWWRPMPPNRNGQMVIIEGETSTNKNGRYEIVFTAVPDESAGKNDWTVFDYSIEITAIDLTGESHDHTTNLSVGFKSQTVETNLAAEFDMNDIDSFQVLIKNLQGIPQIGKGTIKVEKLKEPETLSPLSYWGGGDRTFLANTEDKIRTMPVFETRRFDTWAVEKKTAEQVFETSQPVSKKVFQGGGVYKISLESKDAFGKEITRVSYHVISDFEEKKFPKVEPLMVSIPNKIIEPGEIATVKFGNTEKPVFVTIMVESAENVVYKEHFKISKSFEFQYPVKEVDRGGVFIHVFYVYGNRRFNQTVNISVPYTQKQLDIHLETFREKVMPGAEESYSFVVKGEKKDAVLAEFMATMFDASLESFVKNQWEYFWYNQNYSGIYYDFLGFQMVSNTLVNYDWNRNDYIGNGYYNIPTLQPFSIFMSNHHRMYSRNHHAEAEVMLESRGQKNSMPPPAQAKMSDASADASVQETNQSIEKEPSTVEESVAPTPRKNLNELVFFFPQLQTDENGHVKFTFTMNEALTKWKMMTLAHTPDLKVGYNEWFVQTHKKLMVFPNAPRFMRNGDQIFLTAKVVNQEKSSLPVHVEMKITETLTGKDVTRLFIKENIKKNGSLESLSSDVFAWDVKVPEDYTGNITWTVWATAEGHSDGEEHIIPILTNRQLITETMPLYTGGKEEKTTKFTSFETNQSASRKDHRFTIEYTSHPIWYAIQALPYLAEQGYENTEQIINRFFANALASKIANSHPKIKAVFDQWKKAEPEALSSKLLANPELKTALMEETPWVLQGIQEEAQRRNIAMLFENTQLAHELKQTLKKLAERQLPNGAFPWYVNGRPDLYMTQYIIESLGQMSALGLIEPNDDEVKNILQSAFDYTDRETLEQYKKNKPSSSYTNPMAIHYLYLRTLFPDQKLPEENKAMAEEFFEAAKKDWLKQNLYTQAIIGLVMQHKKDALAKQIYTSFEERSFSKDEMGKYWNAGNGYRWDELPIERQAKMIEFYSKMGQSSANIAPLKVWILKNKQSRHWPTSKSTASAIYALLLEGEGGKITHWVEETGQVNIYLGQERVQFDDASTGSGYVKKNYEGMIFPKGWGQITVSNPNSTVTWGAAYYQYFEDIQKIKAVTGNPLSVGKKMYLVQNNDRGEILKEITAETKLKPGDKILVKLRIQSDRSMDYVHLKDGRPAGVEPVETLSGQKYSGGLGYYENIKDLASHFYIHHLPKGDFTIEYRVKVVHKGKYSAGLATLQSMYAPEFAGHSQGFLLEVK